MHNISIPMSHTGTIVLALLITDLAMTVPETGSVCHAEQVPGEATIESTMPPDRYVYPGEDLDEQGNPTGLDRFSITFSTPVDLVASMISIEVSDGSRPAIVSVWPVGQDHAEWTVQWSEPIPPGESATFVFFDTHTIVLSALPGDVNQDGIVSTEDLTAFLEAYQHSLTDPLYHDIDANGIVDVHDYDRIEQIHEEADSLLFGASGTEHSEQTVVCCADEGACTFYFADQCPPGTASVECPCPSLDEA